jgi:hypothetical protein
MTTLRVEEEDQSPLLEGLRLRVQGLGVNG